MAIIDTGDTAQRVFNNLLDKKIQIEAHVSIAGKAINFVTLNIDQTYGDHHYFAIKIAFDILQRTFMNNPLEQIELIGKKVHIEIQHGDDNANAYIFEGVVTDIEMTGENGEHGYILLKGASPTILLERGKRYDSYSEMTLLQLFKFITETKGSAKLSIVNNPTYESIIDNQIQWNESDWEFVKRMCYQYGINIFYSGSELLIGDYKKEWEPIPLTYDKELTTFKFCSKLLPNVFTNYTYNPERDDTLERTSRDSIENSNKYLDKVQERNEVLQTDDIPFNPLSIQNLDAGELDELVAAKQSRTAARTVYIKGEAKTYKSTIGRLITVSLPDGMSQMSGFGTYRVVKSTHFIDQNHIYHNSFEAVPASLKSVPFAEPTLPIANSIEATVKDTDDPMGQGRVRVQFPFKTYNLSGWLRVMTPDGGLTADGAKNRGLVFVPEKETKVIVNFQMNNPAFPYVAGALFHGKNGQGGGANNHIKSIITRSGHTVEFDDDNASWGITIKDKNENVIHLDTSGKSILISAPEKISIVSNDIEITAKNQLILNSDKDTIQTVGTEFGQHINGDSNISYGKNLVVNVGSDTKFSANKDVMSNIQGEYAQIVSQSIRVSSSDVVEIQSQADMTLKSGSNVFIAD